MKFDLVSTAVLALALSADHGFAAGHGPFAQKARDALNVAKRTTQNLTASGHHPKDDFRFLSKETKRTQLPNTSSRLS
jgi:carboxypeptidase D